MIESYQPATLCYATCPVCGEDDCRYDEIEPTCSEGHAWTITSTPLKRKRPDSKYGPFTGFRYWVVEPHGNSQRSVGDEMTQPDLAIQIAATIPGAQVVGIDIWTPMASGERVF